MPASGELAAPQLFLTEQVFLTEMCMNRMAELIDHGQSCWMDDLSRRMIASGDLARRVADEGLRGITSNPTIFEKAVAQGADYDADTSPGRRRPA
jgi:hypothetical protein